MTLPFGHSTLSDRGGREINEDAVVAGEQNGIACWILCDGLGGHHGGEVASQTAVAAMLDAFRALPEVSERAIHHYLETGEAALAAAQAKDNALQMMRTTAVVLLADGASAAWGHIGDSRLYHFRGGRIVSQTRDHSVPGVFAATGQITLDEIRHHVDRSRLLRSLGEGIELKPTIQPPVAIADGDAFLLCSDGFWEYVLEAEMEGDLAAARTADEWLAAMRQRLAARVLGEHDNFSAVAICFGRRAAVQPPLDAATVVVDAPLPPTLVASDGTPPLPIRADAPTRPANPMPPPRPMAPPARPAPPRDSRMQVLGIAAIATLAVGIAAAMVPWRTVLDRPGKGTEVPGQTSKPSAPAGPRAGAPPAAAAQPAASRGGRDPLGAAEGPPLQNTAETQAKGPVPKRTPADAEAPPAAAESRPAPAAAENSVSDGAYREAFIEGIKEFRRERWQAATGFFTKAYEAHKTQSLNNRIPIPDKDGKPIRNKSGEVDRMSYVPTWFLAMAKSGLGDCAGVRVWAPLAEPIVKSDDNMRTKLAGAIAACRGKE